MLECTEVRRQGDKDMSRQEKKSHVGHELVQL
jgi:hypothetical protein